VDAIDLHDEAADPRVRAIEWIAQDLPARSETQIGVTPSVFGSIVPGVYPELRDALERPHVHFDEAPVERCPSPSAGPRYLIVSRYRDPKKAPRADPWQPLWSFRDCAG
jgi:hypothetical protein